MLREALKQQGTVGPRSAAELLRDVRLTDKKTLVSQIYEVLRELIVSVELKPLQRLSEIEISDALKASKTPVREALIRLEDAGLVTIVPKSGTYVTLISIERYVEGCFVRLQLERGAVRRAAESDIERSDMARLEAIIAEQARVLRKGSDAAFYELDELLHRTIFEVAGIAGAWWAVKRSQADVDRIRHLKLLHNIRRGPDVIGEHKRIVEAIGAGKPDVAEAVLVAHLGSLERELEGLTALPFMLDYIEAINSQHLYRRARRA